VVAHRVAGVVEAVKFSLDDRQFLSVAHGVGDGCEIAQVFEDFLIGAFDLGFCWVDINRSSKV
jgi:hypothetical protein